jgi:RNA-splicing ligase RtcB
MSDLKIFTENIEPEALNQIYTLIKQPAFAECKVRIMPDVHAGKGCVIGFTADLGDKVIPNIVGVDIGCGMLAVGLGGIDINYEKFDSVIRGNIPSGLNVRKEEISFPDIEKLHCRSELKNINWLRCSMGSLGGGNHFIEVDEDPDGNKYLIIHTGSRNLGKQVAEIYQQVAIDSMQGSRKLEQVIQELIKEYRTAGRVKEIEPAIKELKRKFQPDKLNIPKELCYLIGEDREHYLHDMKICQSFAGTNRECIASIICQEMGWEYSQGKSFQTIHNYIDHDTNIVRKGAISARKDELLLIPINMRDGSIIGRGKGNDDWNSSAPHGAGRIMSRSKAKEKVSLEEFEISMTGIFTTSVNRSTIDESPMVYKPMEEIIQNIKETVDIEKIIKPVYNYKASE